MKKMKLFMSDKKDIRLTGRRFVNIVFLLLQHPWPLWVKRRNGCEVVFRVRTKERAVRLQLN